MVVQPSPIEIAQPAPTLVIQLPLMVATAQCPTNTDPGDHAYMTTSEQDIPLITTPTPDTPTLPPTTIQAAGPTAVPVTPLVLDHLPPSSASVSRVDYPKFITPGVLAHLTGVTGIEGWSDLVQTYLEFENASPSKSVSLIIICVGILTILIALKTTRLPHKQRPDEVGAWLKNPTGSHPVISNSAAYTESWKAWWIECQPQGRVVAPWPPPREPLAATQWGRLTNGGKYGVFLFVMSLSWWVGSSDLAPRSPELAAVISDLEWVLRQLIDVLAAPTLDTPTTPVNKRKIVLTQKALDAGDGVKKRFRRQ